MAPGDMKFMIRRGPEGPVWLLENPFSSLLELLLCSSLIELEAGSIAVALADW